MNSESEVMDTQAQAVAADLVTAAPSSPSVVEGAEPAAPPVALRAEFVVGIFDSMPAEQYHAIEAMSASGAKEAERSMNHFRYWREHPDNEPTPAKVLGTAIHTAILEPNSVDTRYIVVPEGGPKRPSSTQRNAKNPSPETLRAIDWWGAFEIQAAGRVQLSATDYETVVRMRDAAWRHPAARALLTGARTEVSLFWHDAATGVPCKARADILNGDIFVADVKSTEDAEREAFGRSIAGYAYHMQGAHYWYGIEHLLGKSPDFFAFIAVEKEPPHGVWCPVLQPNHIRAGMARISRVYAAYKRARDTGYYPSYQEQLDAAWMPPWALKDSSL